MAERDKTYQQVVDDAVNDLSEHGYDSAERVTFWQMRIKEAAERTMASTAQMETILREAMVAIYKRLVERGGLIKFHQGVGRFTLEQVRPQLRLELDRRIMAAADLIKLNRRESVEKTLRRFAGWSTSIPRGGAAPGQKAEAKVDIKKGLKQLPFVERRVLIDQGHKLTASLNEILAVDGGALAVIWRSKWRQPGYNFRQDHKDRDGHVYALRDNWAQAAGLMKVGPDGYYDQITSVAEEPFCRCSAQFIHSLGKLPKDMLTRKGEQKLAEAHAA